MKISNSKKQLARIISENGGWRDGAEFAAQDKDGEVFFYDTKPTKRKESEVWHHSGVLGGDWIEGERALPNWHQTVLSRDEYFHLSPAPDADGWIEWKSSFYGEMPVPEGTEVDIMVDGTVYHRYVAEVWKHWGTTTKYRLYKGPVSTPDAGVKVTVENATTCHLTVTDKLTIEQLAADYRNRKDYADRKQQEADDAKADAEAKLAELVAAGRALGLVLGVAPVEPELVITDWRDLRVGDVIEVTGSHNEAWYKVKGEELTVKVVRANGASTGRWLVRGNTEFRLIRRPAKGDANA